MRQDQHRFALLALGAALAAMAGSAPALAATESLTLYEHPSFQGRHITYLHGSESLSHQGFLARSARSVGLWTLCDGRAVESHCQTVNGAAAKLKETPSIVRPGVDAIALYEQPGLKGRRIIYSFPSDQPPGFHARSARTWGGPWSLCDITIGRCETIDGAGARAVNIEVAAVRPGVLPARIEVVRPAAPTPPPARLTVAMAPPEPPPVPARIAEAAPPPEPPPEPTRIAEAGEPPDSVPEPVEIAEASPPPEPPPPPEASQAGEVLLQQEAQAPTLAEEARPSPYSPGEGYVDLPLPERPLPPRLVQPRPEPRAPDQGLRRVAYQCEGGRSLTVVFDDWGDTAEIKAPGDDPVFLQKVGSDSGFRYQDRDLAFFGDRGEASYVSGRRDPLDCWTAQARRQLTAR